METNRSNLCSGIPELDLHGYAQNAAIRKVTDFLEQNSTHWVRIITGTGSHSSGTGGPVLRTAVQKLLEKRSMEFRRDTPGSFLVNGESGTVLYAESQMVDTKVLLVNRDDSNINNVEPMNLIPSSLQELNAGDTKPQALSTVPLRNNQNVDSKVLLVSRDQVRSNATDEDEKKIMAPPYSFSASAAGFPAGSPLLDELAKLREEEIRLLEQVRYESLEEVRKQAHAAAEDDRELKAALQQSLREASKEEELLRQAIAMSEQELEKQTQQQEQQKEMLELELTAAVRLSLKLSQEESASEQEFLRRALEISQLEERKQHHDEEEEMLRIALELSARQEEAERIAEERILQKVLAESEQQTTTTFCHEESSNTELMEALQHSLQDAKTEDD